MSSLHLEKDGTITDLSTDLDSGLDKIVIPDDWKEATITFHGSIDASMNILFGTLGHRVCVTWGVMDGGITQGAPNVITIRRHPDHGMAYLRQFLLGLTLQHPETKITFMTKEKRSEVSRRSTTNVLPNTQNSQPENSPLPQIIASGREWLRRLLSGTT